MAYTTLKWILIALGGAALAAVLWLRSLPNEPLPFELSWNTNTVEVAIVVAAADGHFFRTEALTELRQLEQQFIELGQPEGTMVVEAMTNYWWLAQPSDALMPLIAEPVPKGVGMLSAIAERAQQEPEIMGRLLSPDWEYASLLLIGSAAQPIHPDQEPLIRALVKAGNWAQSWLCTSPQACEVIQDNRPNPVAPSLR